MSVMYLPAGARHPTQSALDAFYEAARAANRALTLPDGYQVRWIGLDADTTRQVFELIRARDKTGTFSLPWIFERTGQPEPRVGDRLILIDMDGRPTLLLRLTRVYSTTFGRVTAADTAVDGSPVRDPAVWVPLHTQYWNDLLRPFGLTVTADMPFWVEQFELLYDAG
jgi:uncharacterized protein YhfF